MVFIKKLELRGFKSFKESVNVTLDKGFLAVTGPNGSGKSNIFDAMIFALGESRAKALRVNRLASVICDVGPEGKETYARVTVHIDNSDRRIPVDSDSVSVSREIRENGENFYHLNGRRITRNALGDILDMALLVPGGLNIVPQGMVTRISDLLPDEKRRLVEDLVGISQFDQKKAQSMEQLREADVKLQVAVAKMDEIKSRVRDLEAERNDQIRLRHLEDSMRWLRAVKLSESLRSLRKRTKEVADARRVKEEALLRMRIKFEEVERELSNQEEERKRFVVGVIDGAGARQAQIQYKIAKLSNEVQGLESLCEDATATITKLEGEIPKMKEERENAAKRMEGLRREITEDESRIHIMEKEAKEKERLHHSMAGGKAKLEREGSIIRNRLESVRKRIDALGESSRGGTSRLEALKQRHDIVSERMKSLSEKDKAFQDLLARLEQMTRDFLRHKEVEEQSLKDLLQVMKEVLAKKSSFEEELSRAMTTRNKVTQEVSNYEVKRSVAELMNVPELTIRSVMDLASEGVVHGIIGPFRELVSCDHEYEQAFMASAWRWVNALVVEDMKSMLKLVEVAKRLRLGRMKVIPLSEVEDLQAPHPPRVPGVIGNLSDLVKVEPHLRGVVNFVLGDTVVVSSLSVAYGLSAQGFRSVTLAGDMFEPMGPAVETGHLAFEPKIREEILDSESLSSVKEAVSSLESIISDRMKALQELVERSSRLDREKLLRSLTVERFKGEISTVKIFLVRHKRHSRTIQREIEEVSKSEAGLRTKMERLGKAQETIYQRMEALSKRAEDLTSILASIAQRILTLEEERTKILGSLEELNKRVRDEVTSLAKKKAELELALAPNLRSLEERIGASEELLEERKRSLNESKPRIEPLKKELETYRQEEREILEAAKTSRQILEAQEANINGLRSRVNSARTAITSMEKEILNYGRTLESLDDREQKVLSELSLYGYTKPPDPFAVVDGMLEEIGREYEDLRTRVNLLADSTYKSVFEGYKNLSLRRNELETDRDAIVKFIEGIDAEKRKMFMSAFEKVDRELRTVFRSITGGSAWLELEDPDDIFSGGIFLMVEFPGKVAREASAVSGGEKSISALSFILSIQSVFPSPFYLFDEIDAHLDPVNSERLAELLKERAKNSQIIAITLRDTMVSRADLVCGIYMSNGVSQILRYRPGMEVQVRGA